MKHQIAVTVVIEVDTDVLREFHYSTDSFADAFQLNAENKATEFVGIGGQVLKSSAVVTR